MCIKRKGVEEGWVVGGGNIHGDGTHCYGVGKGKAERVISFKHSDMGM